MPWVDCQRCQGVGTIRVEVSLGRWARKPCPARCVKGRFNTSTV